MRTHLRAIVTGLAIAAVIAVSSVAVASATTPVVAGGPGTAGTCATQAAAVKAGATVENLRAFGDCEIARRFTTLDKLAARVTAAKVLTGAHASALSGDISSTRSGLTSLKATIDAETSLPALKLEVKRIATDYRVYVLVAPKVNLVIGADRVQATKPVFDKLNANLSARIAAARAAGKDTTAAQAALDAMNAAAAQAISLTSPLPGNLLPLTPAQWNAGTAGPVLNSSRAALVQARGLIQSARKDAVACRDALK